MQHFVNTVQRACFLSLYANAMGCSHGAFGVLLENPSARDSPGSSMGIAGGGKGIALMFRVSHVYFLSAEAL